MRGSKASPTSWVFWCRFCQWQDARRRESGQPVHMVTPEAATHRQDPSWIHGVHLCSSDLELIDSLEEYLFKAWSAGGTGIVVATAAHRSALRERLAARGLTESVGQGHLIELDAEDTLSLFMRDGVPDRDLFDESVGSVVRELAAEGPLHTFGEMVDVLCAEGNAAAALELEGWWSELQRGTPFSLMCAYAESHLDHSGRAAVADLHDHQVAVA